MWGENEVRKISGSKKVKFENRDYYLEISINIAYYRKKAGLTQEALAEKIGISRSYLGAIEAPNFLKPFSLETLFDIANALDVEPYQLLRAKE